MSFDDVKYISFYLPQYHPVPENNEWWGKGFTEWTNVTKARSIFPGHYQPHLPADLGFYDLRLAETREAQANLAQQSGVSGFCYYHYWFNGRRILERPFNEVLESQEPNFPFCLCWANENWTRVWDGGQKHILLEQNYNHQDDEDHIRSLFPAFFDKRYIRIDGKPLFLVYRTELMPDPKRTAEIWREIALKEGVGEIYLARVENFVCDVSPTDIGFDAGVEFAPDWRRSGQHVFNGMFYKALCGLRMLPKALSTNEILYYDTLVNGMLRKPSADYVQFRCVTPGWDNSARRRKDAHIFIGSTPEKYAYWLSEVTKKVDEKYSGDQKIVFINAWNEWAEGNHLEPDRKWGHSYLDATYNAKYHPEKLHNCISNAPSVWDYVDTIKYYYQKHMGWRFNSSSN